MPKRRAFNGHHFCFKLQTVGVDRSTHLKDIWWFSSDTRRFTAGTGPDQSCLDSLGACSKLTYLLSRRKTCLMLDHWCLPCSFFAWKRLKWFRWGSYLFQGQSPENILADWEKVAICSLLYFHEMNDASKKRNSDDIWRANGILFKVGTFLLSVFNFCGYKDRDLFINDYLAQCLENVCILLVQHTNLLWWFWENPRLFKSGNRWSSKLNCISQSGHVLLSASLFSLYVSCLLSS